MILLQWQVYEDATNVYLVTELLRGGELLDKILAYKRLSEREAADVMAVVAETIAYLHRSGVGPAILVFVLKSNLILRTCNSFIICIFPSPGCSSRPPTSQRRLRRQVSTVRRNSAL